MYYLEMKASRYLIILLLIFAAGSIQPVVADDIWEGVFSYQKKMAEHGHPEAQIKLGEMYEEGHGTERDFEMARHWYQKAAEQGYSEGGKKLAKLQARQQREEEERKRAEQRQISREHEQAEPARASEQVRRVPEAEDERRGQLSQEEREAKAAEEARKKKQAQQALKRRAEEAMKEMMATPEAYSEEQ